MANTMDKRDLPNLPADITQFWDESVDFEPNFVEHDGLPLVTEKLYKRILHGIVKSAEDESYKSELQNFIRAAFGVSDAQHSDLLQDVNQQNPTEIYLNIDVIEAQQLDTKHSNGLTNPFVTMHIESLALQQCATTAKSNTLNPMWEEQFSLSLANGSIDNEHLIVEVWHFKTIETMREKVKSPRHFGKFIKKIATMSSGSHDQELIGRCTIPLKTIPVSGLCTSSHQLFKNDKPKSRGTITLQLSIGADAVAAKNKLNAITHHDRRNLLRTLLQHELKKSPSNSWQGQFSDLGDAILVHSGHTINERAQVLAQWSEFTAFHTIHALPFELFENLLMTLLPLLNCTEMTTQEEMDIFWDGVKKLLPSCFMVFRNSRQRSDIDMEIITQSLSVVSTINMLALPPPAQDIELFPKKIYGWLNESNAGNIHKVVEEAIRSRAQDYLLGIMEFRFVHQECIESNLKNIIKVMELIELDLRQAREIYHKLFMSKMNCDYAAICYIYYANEIAECFEMTIKRTCEHLVQAPASEHEDIAIGTALFEVYLALKRFAKQSVQFCAESTQLEIHKYHDWFVDGVTYWLAMHHFTAFTRIEKAIEMDRLVPVDEMVKYSTSAIDTLAIFQSIRKFWLHLNWPDVESSYTFMAKIVDDICDCSVNYADRMAARMLDSTDMDEFCVTPSLCLTINDIEYLQKNLSTFIAELEMNDIIAKLAICRSHADAQRCRLTLKSIIENAMDSIENQITDLIEHIAFKMCTYLQKDILNAAKCVDRNSHMIDQLMENLERSQQTLSTYLHKVNCQRILTVVWQKFKTFFSTLLQNCLNTQCTPELYSNLCECLQIITKSFKCHNDALIECGPIAEFERVLRLHSRDTDYLIHQYYIERYRQQLKMNDAPFGQLTIRADFIRTNFLELEVLNARNLVSEKNDSFLDPFVKIKISPSDRNSTKMEFKTAPQNKTLFPLFDEKFVIPISKKQQAFEDCLIIFSIKNHDRFGISNKYLAECFLTFDDIRRHSPKDQIHLALSIPTSMDGEYLGALKSRECDKSAKKFIKKLKRTLSSLAK